MSRSVFNDTHADESGVGLRVGDTFLGFTLIEELGQGAFARVFLAHQQSLAGRPVALKVTLRPTREAERLARLQHTNVVPVYSVHNAPPVQVICMPFLGRRTIADVIRAYHNEHSSREYSNRRTAGTRAARTTDVVESGSRPSLKTNPPETPKPLRAVAGGQELIGDPLAVLRVIGQLASGLAHAHGRKILHLDLKPANVLLPDIGEPMLLDFNLSFDTTMADRELVGGTVPYMATEQLLDLRTRGRGEVDARTDLYSLGVMAYEMLTGVVPFPAASRDLIDMESLIAVRRQGPPSIREQNPQVTPAVEAIIHKLLAPEPVDRYQSAEDLKTDIDRHLSNRPLMFAREPSVRERLAKWRRRNPGATWRLLTASLLGLVLAGSAIAYKNSETRATAAASALAQQTRTALDTTRLDLILPGDKKSRERGIAKAEELLAAYGLPGNHEWKKGSDVRRLAEPEQAAIGEDLGELLILLAQAKWLEVETQTDPTREEGAAEALKLNRAARACFPADAIPAVLERQAKELAFAAGEATEPAIASSRVDSKSNARDCFLQAAFDLSNGKFATAVPLLDRVIAEQSNHAAAHFCLAYSRQQLAQFERSLERYDIAESLLPRDARPAFQRGVIRATQRRYEDAETEYSRAIILDSTNANAFRNRGFARFRLEKYEQAESDLTRSLELGAAAIPVHTYRAQAREKLGNTSGAAADRAAASALPPRQEADYISRGTLHWNSDPKAALEEFKAASVLNSRSLVALQNQLSILADKLHDPAAALVVATRLVELFPDYASGKIDRAVVLARLAQRTEAHEEAERAMRLSKDPSITYRAACVFALTSTEKAEDRTKAIALLERAIKDGFKGKELHSDHDLDPIRDNKRFREIADAAHSLFQ